MKKLLIVSFLLASLNAAYAQHKPVTFTLKGGLTISNIYSSSSTDISSDNYAGGPYQSTSGFFVEGTADVSIGKAWSLMPGLSFTGKGAEGPLEATKHLYYAELPVNLVYNIYAGNDKLSLGGGLYAGYLLSSAESVFKWDGLYYDPVPGAEDVANGAYYQYYKKFDYGINLTAGYTFGKHISINTAYQFGLGTIRKNEFGDDFNLQNRVFKIGLGYTF
jgi:hypothetical protein